MKILRILGMVVAGALVALLLALAGIKVYQSLRGREIPREALQRHVERGRIAWAIVTSDSIVARQKELGTIEGRVRAPLAPETRAQAVRRLKQKGVHIIDLPPGWTYWVFSVVALMVFSMWQGQVTAFPRSVLAASFYVYLLWIWHLVTPMPATWAGYESLASMRFKIFDSGWIPFAILGAFLAGLHYLYQMAKYRLLPLGASQPDNAAIFAAARESEAKLLQVIRQLGESNLYSRLLGRVWRRFHKEPDLSTVISYKDELLDIEEEKISLGFVAVRWCEVVLPLLGFLGTVVGVGGAIESVATGIRALFKGQPMETALDDLNRGFQGLGLAFDTTFLGLAGVIGIGLFHMMIKKEMASRLADARDLLTDVVYRWSAGNSVVIALGDIEGQLRMSDDRLLALEEAVRTSDREAREFREAAQLTIERVIREDKQFDSIRQVLFRPVVEFQDVGSGLLRATQSFLNKKLGRGWKLRALGIANLHGGVLAVQGAKGEGFILPFQLDGPIEGSFVPTEAVLGDLLPIEDSTSVLGITDGVGTPGKGAASRQLRWLKLKGTAVEENDLRTEFRSEDRVLPVLLGDTPRALVLCGVPHSLGWQPALSNGGHLVDLKRLPESFEWKCFATYPGTASLFALGEPVDDAGKPVKDGSRRLMLTRLVPSSPEDGKSRRRHGLEETARLDFDSFENYTVLPRTIEPRQVVPLAEDMALILDETGRLYYWDVKRKEPLELRDGWRPAKGCTLRAGKGGWIAVAQGDELSMWQVQRGGWIHRYDGGSPVHKISGVIPESFRATLDGQYLFALGPDAIFTWKFPEYAVDKV